MLFERGHKPRTWVGAGNDEKGQGGKTAARGDGKAATARRSVHVPGPSSDVDKAGLALWIS